MRNMTIVVGTDGTAASRPAIGWAAREAERRGMRLHIVHAFAWDWQSSRYVAGTAYVDEARQVAEGITAEAREQARTVAPAVWADTDTLIGNPAAQLLAVAETAELMVLGNRGRGGLASLVLGSVSQRVATHAPGPVVIVRGRGDITEGPVVAGVDHSPAAEHVLQVAFEEATSRNCALAAVRTYLPSVPLWIADMPSSDVDVQLDAGEQATLDELLAPWRQKYPQVPIETVVSRKSTAAVLESVSQRAQLIVVGSRERGSVAGVLLGSTGVELLRHADCPVLIARQRPEAASYA